MPHISTYPIRETEDDMADEYSYLKACAEDIAEEYVQTVGTIPSDWPELRKESRRDIAATYAKQRLWHLWRETLEAIEAGHVNPQELARIAVCMKSSPYYMW